MSVVFKHTENDSIFSTVTVNDLKIRTVKPKFRKGKYQTFCEGLPFASMLRRENKFGVFFLYSFF